MAVSILEKICLVIDRQSPEADNSIEDILKKANIPLQDPDENEYKEFAAAYMALARKHFDEKQRLMQPDSGRVMVNTIGFAAISLIYMPKSHIHNQSLYDIAAIIAAGALIGAGLTIYDERKQKGMNLLYAGMGALGGAAFGLFLGDAYGSDALKYVFGLIGSVTGAALMLRNAKKDAYMLKNVQMQGLEREYKNKKREIIQFYSMFVK